MKFSTTMAIGVLTAMLTAPGTALAQYGTAPGAAEAGNPTSGKPGLLSKIGIDQKLNQQVPLDLMFTDETGRDIRLGDLFGKRPVVLALVYYECPMLCTQVLNGVATALSVMEFNVGREFDVVAVSINPKEGPQLAAQKKAAYVQRYGRPGTEHGWHFLTGRQDSITKLAEAVGFRYEFDKGTGQFAHGAGIEVLTPQRRHLEVLLRDRVFVARSQVRRDAGARRAHRQRNRQRAAALLSLRPGNGAVRHHRARACPGGGRGDDPGVSDVSVRQPQARTRIAERGGRDRTPNLTMFTNLPFFPQQASAQANQVDGIFFFMVAVTAFFSLLIAALIVFFAIKYRRRSDNEVGVAIHGSLALELLWTIIPFFIAMVMFGWGAKVFFELYRPPAGAMEIYVVGKQWMWKVQHLDGQREINELHVPVGRPVKLIMGSEDVIHSFYIPAFRVKPDVMPGRYNALWFKATKAGRYHLFCAEYCGTKHSGMIGSVVAMEPADYQAWLSGGRAEDSPVAAGAKLFQDLDVRHLPP